MAAVSYSILANLSIFWQILGRQGHLKRANITLCNPWCYQLWVQVRLNCYRKHQNNGHQRTCGHSYYDGSHYCTSTDDAIMLYIAYRRSGDSVMQEMKLT